MVLLFALECHKFGCIFMGSQALEQTVNMNTAHQSPVEPAIFSSGTQPKAVEASCLYSDATFPVLKC